MTMTLADQYTAAKSKADAIAKELESLRKQILATGVDRLAGEFADLEIALSERSTLDSKAAKALMTSEQIASCTKTALVETIRIKAKVMS